MVTAQREESVLASLNELRSLEQQRVDDERAARERARAEAEAARLEADRRREAEARATRDAEEAEVRRREDAERAAVRQQELAIALAEAEARAKAEAELATARMAQELELRRTQVQRTRPVLLFVVTGVLAVVGIGAAYIAMQRGDEIANIQKAIQDANKQTKEAQAVADGLRRQTEASEATRAQVQKMLDDKLAELTRLSHAAPTAGAEGESTGDTSCSAACTTRARAADPAEGLHRQRARVHGPQGSLVPSASSGIDSHADCRAARRAPRVARDERAPPRSGTEATMTMRWLALAACCVPACSCNNHGAAPDGGDVCDPACTGDLVCRYGVCVPPPTPCTQNIDCPGDTYCDTSRGECLPWGVGPGGANDPGCKRDPVPGVFFPGVQCEWLGPPAGDAFPNHVNVLATPMVAPLYITGELTTPSIVFTSYNFTDGGAQSCEGTDPSDFGVIRIIDGRTCTQQATIAAPTVIASASVAIADIGGLDDTPEIIAARTGGGLVAFTLKPTGWDVLWTTSSTFGHDNCDWAGPSVHDLDDDGIPEIIFYGAVYDANGNTLDESLAASVDAVGVGYIPVIADVDGDGVPELVTGSRLYSWDKAGKHWVPKQTLPAANGQIAVADFGTYPASGADDRAHLDGIAEIVVVYAGVAHVYNIYGREVFTANLQAIGGPAGQGGPPTIADFDGDGRVEFASAGATAYTVFDPDCQGTPDPATCRSMRTDGVLWAQQSQDASSNVTGSSVFDFDGDGRAEVVYGDECFTRVYDGLTGKVLYSRYRTSCTWYENPVIADTDADFNAEIVSTSNTNCAVTCPAIDAIFDGVQCLDDADCPKATHCGREQPNDPLGRCRCGQDTDCGGDGFICLDPIAGPSAAGKVCRASHPAGAAATGVRVLADSVDRWVNTRAIWNQHAYSVTNIDLTGKVPRTSQWLQNWKQPGLNNFRQNSPGDGMTAGAIPDLTVHQAKVTCDPGGPTITAEVCNRGTEPVAQDVPVAVYANGPPRALRCSAATTQRIYPGFCATVTCTWNGGSGDGVVVVDDRGDGTGIDLECREDNNELAISVACP